MRTVSAYEMTKWVGCQDEELSWDCYQPTPNSAVIGEIEYAWHGNAWYPVADYSDREDNDEFLFRWEEERFEAEETRGQHPLRKPPEWRPAKHRSYWRFAIQEWLDGHRTAYRVWLRRN